MLPRILEPEVMDTPEEAEDYDRMDHAEVNRRFVYDLLAFCGLPDDNMRVDQSFDPTRLLDVGTGTALIPIELVRCHEIWNVHGIDLAASMLLLGQQNIERAGVSQRVQLELVDAKHLPFVDGCFPGVISNSIVHHIPSPIDAFREMRRVLCPNGFLFVRDLLRPDSIDDLEHLVDLHTVGAIPSQRQLFRQSLHASLTIEEVRQLLRQTGFDPGSVQQTSDRHWTIATRLRDI
ncbi:MAG: methyltransferase domain-containing protein [Planctomycetaceae bacterium]